jgi:serine protease DegQ
MNMKKIMKISALCIPLLLSQQGIASTSTTYFANEQPSISPMLKKTMPSVVSVSVEGKQEIKQKTPPELRKMYKNLPSEQIFTKPFKSIGSGVIFNSKEGIVVTNSHVVENADKIFITLNNGDIIEAEVLGKDTHSDIAVLKVKSGKLKQIELANSNEVEVGDFVVAIGNPFGLSQTVTTGIVSAKGRAGLGVDNLENFIQTDAAINKGNSGGALVNWKGELIGINTAIVAPAGGSVGIGFAIPSNMMRNLVEQIVEHGEVKRGLLGITGVNLNSVVAKALSLNINKGAFVRDVSSLSAADKSGLEAGDVIFELNNYSIDSFDELRARVGTRRAGSTINLKVNRKNETLSFEIILGGLPDKEIEPELIHSSLKDVDIIEDEGNLVVTSVPKSSLAARIGLNDADIIIKANNIDINNLSQLKEVFDSKERVVVLEVTRKNKSVYLIISK